MKRLKFICDNSRHLICVPYSIENLHLMAKELGLKKHWFHKNHYDIPKGRIEEISKKCIVVGAKNIVEIIKSPEYAEIIIGDEAIKQEPKRNNQELPEHTTLKYNGF